MRDEHYFPAGFGEIGLTGEIRPVQSGLERMGEAEKQGFMRAIVPFDNAPRNKSKIGNLEVIAVRNIQELVGLVQ